MQMNWLILLVAALVPLVLGFIWYSPGVFGNAWMRAAGISRDKMKGVNMGLVFVLTFVFSFLMAMILQSIVIHQFSLYSLVANDPKMMDPTSEAGMFLKNTMDKYGHNFRTFKHGALHGTITGLFLALPIISVNAMFERRGFKYIAINAGFWIVCLAIMGGILCQWV